MLEWMGYALSGCPKHGQSLLFCLLIYTLTSDCSPAPARLPGFPARPPLLINAVGITASWEPASQPSDPKTGSKNIFPNTCKLTWSQCWGTGEERTQLLHSIAHLMCQVTSHAHTQSIFQGAYFQKLWSWWRRHATAWASQVLPHRRG